MRSLLLALVFLLLLPAPARSDGLPAGSEPERAGEPQRPSELEDGAQQSFRSIPPEYLDLSGVWVGELGGQAVEAVLTRGGTDLSRYTISITLPDGTVLALEAVFDGRGLRCRVARASAVPLADGATIGLSGALEEADQGLRDATAAAPTFAERVAAALSELFSTAREKGAAAVLDEPSGRYALERDADDWVLRAEGPPTSGASPTTGTSPTLAALQEDPTPVAELRPRRRHDELQAYALALGVWTEARDHPRRAKRAEEMRRVGGVMLNREQTAYRDKHSLVEVLLDRYQFSHFNSRSNPERLLLEAGDVAGLEARMSERDRWDEALALARGLLDGSIANPWNDPFVRHYYSPRSMVPRGSQPAWVVARREVRVRGISRKRFRWFRRIP